MEPTPENFARAYQTERGDGGAPVSASGPLSPASAGPADSADGEAWAVLIERTVRGLERGAKQWTTARKKDSLARVLGGSRSDAKRLQKRLSQLVASWDTDTPHEAPASDFAALDGNDGPTAPTAPSALTALTAPTVLGPVPGGAEAVVASAGAAPASALASPLASAPDQPVVAAARPSDVISPAAPAPGTDSVSLPTPQLPSGTAGQATAPLAPESSAGAWPQVAADLSATVQAALPAGEARGREVAEQLATLQKRLAHEGPGPLTGEIALACTEAQRVLQHRHHLMDQLGNLCVELTAGLTDLAEDDSWVQGQCAAMRVQLDDGLTARGVRSVSELLATTRERQQQLRLERGAARDALKASIRQMLQEIAALGSQTGRFTESVGRYAEEIDRADSLESLAGAVRELVAESRSVHEAVSQAQARLTAEHELASTMQTRVIELEDEIRRLSNEVSTDPLTQVANRRGLLQAFETERALGERDEQQAGTEPAPALAVALIDIDNFKKLNDRLGHANGDVALQFLTQRVTQALRPRDTLARYGGEEFVVLLPATPVDEAQQVLTRLQRALSAELFMSDAQGQVFVTFSAGVTRYRGGERLEQALERADEALYEAKRAGKNRTCMA
ncbi:MAG: diguanylate cyclase [Methylibium sp.]|nr:diguanylate cyclase [Methylibium sp.]